MITTLIVALLLCIIAGIFLRSVINMLLLVGLVLGVFFVSCYAFDVSPRVILLDGAHAARHEYRAHRREIHEYL